MNDRINPGGGGMTGATGDLTPEETDESFVPGERREIEDPESRAALTDHPVRPPTASESPRHDRGEQPAEEEERF